MRPTVTSLSRATQRNLSLLDADPDLAGFIPSSDHAAARHALSAPGAVLEPGPFEPRAVYGLGQSGFGAVVVSGLITREVSIDSRMVLRLLGPGDLLIADSPGGAALSQTEQWRAAVTSRLAILDDRLLLAVRQWPRLFRAFCSRLQQSHDLTLLQLAVSHRPAAEDRILGLFELLAASWGRVGSDGILVPIALTHEAIGQMIGSRRPTVTLAVRTLIRQRRLKRVDGGWLLAPDGLMQDAAAHSLLGVAVGAH